MTIVQVPSPWTLGSAALRQNCRRQRLAQEWCAYLRFASGTKQPRAWVRQSRSTRVIIAANKDFHIRWFRYHRFGRWCLAVLRRRTAPPTLATLNWELASRPTHRHTDRPTTIAVGTTHRHTDRPTEVHTAQFLAVPFVVLLRHGMPWRPADTALMTSSLSKGLAPSRRDGISGVPSLTCVVGGYRMRKVHLQLRAKLFWVPS